MLGSVLALVVTGPVVLAGQVHSWTVYGGTAAVAASRLGGWKMFLPLMSPCLWPHWSCGQPLQWVTSWRPLVTSAPSALSLVHSSVLGWTVLMTDRRGHTHTCTCVHAHTHTVHATRMYMHAHTDCICARVCITHMHMCTHMYMHMRVHRHARTCVHTCMHVHRHMYVSACVCTHAHVHIHADVYAHRHVHECSCTQTRVHACM